MLSTSRGWLDAAQVKKLIVALAISLGLLFLFGWKLGNLTPGLSPAEANSRASAQSLTGIKDWPLNAPVKIFQFGVSQAGHRGAFWMRLAPAILGVIFAGCFYLIAKNWFGRYIAVLSTLIFATTPWLVLSARSATYNILLLWPMIIVASYIWLNKTSSRKNVAWLCLVAATAIGLYIPGVPWLLLLSLIITWRRLPEIIREISLWSRSLSLVLFLMLLVPLISAGINHPGVFKELFLIPVNWLVLTESIKSILWSGAAIVWHSREHQEFLIGRLAILDFIQLSLLAFGLYAMWLRARRVLFGLLMTICVAVIGAGLNQDLALVTLALPSLALIGAAGLRYLYLQWQQVFPKNPLPKTLALVLMAALVGMHCLYGVRYSLSAWPHTVDTRKTYVLK